MSYFTDEELLQLIETGGSERVEFKESLSGNAPERIREAICSFANDLSGNNKSGVVFVGLTAPKPKRLGFVPNVR